MHKVFLGLGSNIEPKREHLAAAFEWIEKTDGIYDFKKSPLYETAPVGYLDQDDFVNAVVSFETEKTPYEVLDICKSVEEALKRVRKIRWGPRTIDVDVLLYDNLVLEDEALTIPHPRMHERAFVLEPLLALSPAVSFRGKTAIQWLKEVQTSEEK